MSKLKTKRIPARKMRGGDRMVAAGQTIYHVRGRAKPFTDESGLACVTVQISHSPTDPGAPWEFLADDEVHVLR